MLRLTWSKYMEDTSFLLELPTILICRKGIEKEFRTEIIFGAKERKQMMSSSALQDQDQNNQKQYFRVDLLRIILNEG